MAALGEFAQQQLGIVHRWVNNAGQVRVASPAALPAYFFMLTFRAFSDLCVSRTGLGAALGLLTNSCANKRVSQSDTNLPSSHMLV